MVHGTSKQVVESFVNAFAYRYSYYASVSVPLCYIRAIPWKMKPKGEKMKIEKQICFNLESIQEGLYQQDIIKQIVAQVGKHIFSAVEKRSFFQKIAIKFSAFCIYLFSSKNLTIKWLSGDYFYVMIQIRTHLYIIQQDFGRKEIFSEK